MYCFLETSEIFQRHSAEGSEHERKREAPAQTIKGWQSYRQL